MRKPEQAEAPSGPVLLVDTCAEVGSVAVVRGETLLAERWLEARAASVSLLAVIDDVLSAAAVPLRGLSGVGVIAGPGSFTGVRVALALTKGLCEATAVPLATVSRLAVLAEAGGLGEGFAVLHAGRNQVYVRHQREGGIGAEQLLPLDLFREQAEGSVIVLAEECLREVMPQSSEIRFATLTASAAAGLVQRNLASGGVDLATADANYVRDEGAIYRRPSALCPEK